MEDQKRKISPNWLSSEKNLLLELVEKHFHIIENKKTDGVSIKAKLAEWQIISTQYNSQTTHCHREAGNLKSQWESMKKAAKKEASLARIQRLQTGGGPRPCKKEDPVTLKILLLIDTSALGLYNPYDKDSVAPVEAIDIEKIIEVNQSPQPIIQENGDFPPEVIEQDYWKEKTQNCSVECIQLFPNAGENVNMTTSSTHEQELTNNDWGDYTPRLLKNPVSDPLKSKKTKKSTSRRRPTYSPAKTSIEMLHKKKMEAISFQKTLALEESQRNEMAASLDIEIMKEILKQEKIKTRLLMLELRKQKKENTQEEY